MLGYATMQVFIRYHAVKQSSVVGFGFVPMVSWFSKVSGVSRTKIDEVTLNALRTRQSLVKGERLVRHEMRAVLKVKLAKRGASVVIHSLRGLEMHPTLCGNPCLLYTSPSPRDS